MQSNALSHACKANVSYSRPDRTNPSVSRRHAVDRRSKSSIARSTQDGTSELDASTITIGRRTIFFAALSVGPAVSCLEAEARTASTRAAGDFCPPAVTDGFVVYSPDKDATPALRAGVIQPSPSLYSFELPPSWREGTILNILSGNFCMPRCDEPWYESLWESSEEGSATLVISPLYRLISKSSATLKDLGTPEQLVERIGPFITGNYLDSVEDVVAASEEKFEDGKTYYTYELDTPYAKNGSRQLAAFTIKGNLCYLFVTAASDKQWAKSEKTLRHMLKSFKA